MKTYVIAVAAGLVAATAASAQNTGAILTDGTATYRIGGTTGVINASPTTTSSPTMDLILAGASPDHVFNDWWWFRGPNDTREFAIANATSRTVLGANSIEYGYNLGDVQGTLRYTLTQPAANSARVDQSWRLVNPTMNDIELNLFHYIDFDLNGATSNTAFLTAANNRMMVEHAASGTAADWWGTGAHSYQVTTFATLRGLLTNTVVNNLNNTGLPFGPGDYTGGYQWTIVVPGGADVVVRVFSSYGINTPAIPAPGALALLGMGGLLCARRRR